MMRSNQQRHYTEMLVKSQERNQSEEAWHEFTRHYYKVGVKNVEEFTQFGHRLVKVTLYDSIVVLVRGLSSLTYELVYKLLFVICIVILILVLIFRK
jgi:predicted RND superfamily exporter protein